MSSSLSIYNSLSGKTELFKSMSPNYVGMYVCGPTVYNNVHLGNCRTFISFDLIFFSFVKALQISSVCGPDILTIAIPLGPFPEDNANIFIY